MSLADLQKPFPAEDIEWRVGACGQSKSGGFWATCLAYISARAIMDRLDAVVGPENWRCSYRVVEGAKIAPGIVCSLSIKIGDEWVTKEDGADQSDIDAFKGGISGALKRAGVAWGIGRYLYKLESEFAQTSEKKRDGWHRAQTKDKAEFYWTPPALPAWALPEGSAPPEPPKPKAAPAPKAENTDIPKPRTRAQLSAELVTLCKRLDLTGDERDQWIYEMFKKTPKELTDSEMEQFLGTLQGELGRRGEVA